MLIDSNILIYAINEDSPKHKPAQQFLRGNKENLVLSHQNILETIRVLTHPKFPKPIRPKLALDAVLTLAEECRIIAPNNTTYFIALELIREFKFMGNRIFDA